MLVYSMIHLAGVKKVDHDGATTDEPSISLEDIKNFRQLGSPTPGHPESHTTARPHEAGGGGDSTPAAAKRATCSKFDQSRRPFRKR